MERGVHLSSPPSPLTPQSRTDSRRRASPDLVIRNQLLSIRSEWQIRNRGGRGGGGKGGGLPGANRRNAVSIIQLKTDMYRHQVGIVAKPAIVNCWALERRSFRQEDRGTRLLTGRNALCPPFVRRARLASLRVRFYREVFESRKK